MARTVTDPASTGARDAPPAFRLRGGSFTLMVLELLSPDDPRLFDQLRAKLAQAPGFFDGAPLVIDMAAIPDDVYLNIRHLAEALRGLGFVPVGVENAAPHLADAAREAGLCPFAHWRSGRKRSEEPLAARSETPSPQAGREAPDVVQPQTSALITQPVRSGRRVYAHGGDAVIMAPVSAGAEVLADGHVHIYAPLRGRALAGLSGDRTARIFCQRLEAELVCVAGSYKVREDIDESLIGRAVQIFLSDEDDLIIIPL